MFYRWKKQYGGLDVTEIRRLRQLGDENRHLEQLIGRRADFARP
jgi:putative transposase